MEITWKSDPVISGQSITVSFSNGGEYKNVCGQSTMFPNIQTAGLYPYNAFKLIGRSLDITRPAFLCTMINHAYFSSLNLKSQQIVCKYACLLITSCV